MHILHNCKQHIATVLNTLCMSLLVLTSSLNPPTQHANYARIPHLICLPYFMQFLSPSPHSIKELSSDVNDILQLSQLPLPLPFSPSLPLFYFLRYLTSISFIFPPFSLGCLCSFLSVKKWLLRKKHQIELARKRGWKGYWVCLKGTTLLFYPCDSREGRSVEAAPKHLIIVDGAIMQPIPEHPKRDYIFCLSTAFGDAYLFQAPCQVSG